MNRRSKEHAYLLAAALILISIFLSCAMEDEQKPEGGMGTLQITLPGSEEGRMAFSDYVATLSYFLSGAGPASFQDRPLTRGVNKLFLTPGDWALTLSIVNAGKEEVAAQTQTVTIIPGETAKADFVFSLVNPTEQDDPSTEKPLEISITTHPQNITVTQGAIAESLRVGATAGSALFYQWYQVTPANAATGTLMAGATNADFPIPQGLTQGIYYFYCTVSAGGVSKRSETAAVTVRLPKDTPDIPPTISIAGPENITVTQGAIIESLRVDATASDGSALFYQWYSALSTNAEAGTLIAGATGAAFPIPTDLTQGTYDFYCEISGEGVTTKHSNNATVTVILPLSDKGIVIIWDIENPNLLDQTVRVPVETPASIEIQEGDWTTITWYLDSMEQTANAGQTTYAFTPTEAGFYTVNVIVVGETGEYSGSCTLVVYK